MRADLPVGKFTPGPWIATTVTRGNHYIDDVCGNEVAHILRRGDMAHDANARLIAAAPELLAACAAFVAACDSAPPTQLIEHIGKCCEQARAAIAKATGAQ